MKRTFDDHGQWNPEALASGKQIHPLIRQAFDLLRNQGYNPREAQHLIESRVQEETLLRSLKINDHLEQLRKGHEEAAAKAPRYEVHPDIVAAQDAIFTPAHKKRAFELIEPDPE